MVLFFSWFLSLLSIGKQWPIVRRKCGGALMATTHFIIIYQFSIHRHHLCRFTLEKSPLWVDLLEHRHISLPTGRHSINRVRRQVGCRCLKRCSSAWRTCALIWIFFQKFSSLFLVRLACLTRHIFTKESHGLKVWMDRITRIFWMTDLLPSNIEPIEPF